MIIFIGLLFAIAFTFFVGLLCAEVIWFIDLASFVVIALPLIFFFCTTKSGSVLSGYIKSSFRKNPEYGAKELESIRTAARNTLKFTLAVGVYGFFAGIIAMLASLSNPDHLGPALSVSLITLYYAVSIGYFIFFPLQAWAENKMASAK